MKLNPESRPFRLRKNDKYIIEGYDKKMNVNLMTIIRMGGVNPALSEIGRSE